MRAGSEERRASRESQVRKQLVYSRPSTKKKVPVISSRTLNPQSKTMDTLRGLDRRVEKSKPYTVDGRA